MWWIYGIFLYTYGVSSKNYNMDCCQCSKYVCAKCANICDGCGKYYTCKGKCSDQSKEDINKLIGDEYNSYRFKEYRNKIYCAGCFYDVELDIREIKNDY